MRDDYQVVEKGLLPFSEHEKQTLRFLLLSQNQWLSSLQSCRNIRVPEQSVDIMSYFNSLLDVEAKMHHIAVFYDVFLTF